MKKQRSSIKFQVLFSLLMVIAIMAILFSPYGFYTNVSAIRHSIDERLEVSANGARELMPLGFPERAMSGRVSQQEYSQLQKRLIDFQERINVTYLYALMQTKDGRILFLLDSEEKPLTEYKNPSPDTLEAFKTKRKVYAEGTDNLYAITSRTVILPFWTNNGDFFVVGADLNVKDLYPLIKDSIADFLMLMLIGLVLVLVVTMVLSKRIAAPIKRLSDFTEKLYNSNFSQSLNVWEALPESMPKSRELQTLAENIDNMQHKLGEYIEGLALEIAARNRAESELKIAGRIQESFLPKSRSDTPERSFCASMKPAKQAGGDLYETFLMPDGRELFAIGDVSGKGMPAALFMSKAMTLIRISAKMAGTLSDMVAIINDALCDKNDGCTFVTFFVCALSRDGSVEYVNCGHNPPLIKRANADVKELDVNPNRVLGVFENTEFKSQNFSLSKGDTLLCYTDGVTEAMDKNHNLYSDARLKTLLQTLPSTATAEEVMDAVKDSVADYARDAEQSDDITIFVLKLK